MVVCLYSNLHRLSLENRMYLRQKINPLEVIVGLLLRPRLGSNMAGNKVNV